MHTIITSSLPLLDMDSSKHHTILPSFPSIIIITMARIVIVFYVDVTSSNYYWTPKTNPTASLQITNKHTIHLPIYS